MSTDTGAPLNLAYLDPSQSQPEVKINAAWDTINTALGEVAPLEVGDLLDSPGTTVSNVTQIRFAHAKVSEASGGVALVTPDLTSSPLATKGDIWTYSTGDAALSVGTNGQMLVADSTQATGLRWAVGLTTKGDIQTYGTTHARQAVGSNGQMLVSDSTQTTGLRWAAGLTTKGDLQAYSTTQGRFPVGATAGMALVVDSTQTFGMKWSSILFGTTASLTSAMGGSAMTAGQRLTATITITGAAVGMAVACSPSADPGAGFVWHAYVSAANTVTVCVTCVAAGTPTSTTYTARLIA